MAELALELDGPSFHKHSADTPRVVELLAAYLVLLEKLGTERHSPTRFVGLDVQEKCIRLASDATVGRDTLRGLVAEAHELVAGNGVVPRGMQTIVGRVRDGIAKLPPGVSAKAIVGEWEGALELGKDSELPPSFQTELRAIVLRVGGDTPTAALRLVHDWQMITLRLGSVDRARSLAKLLYREVDLVVRIRRDVAGRVEDGEIIEIHEVAGDTSRLWEDWFANHAASWSNIEDIEEELDGD